MAGRWNISAAAALGGVAIARAACLECVSTCPVLKLGTYVPLDSARLVLCPRLGPRYESLCACKK
eukprot:6176925-Pleurochrysis_carterae.AAC.2